MTESEKRQIVIEIAKSYLGSWYIWGGDDPSGFDCSGLAIECLKSVGVLPRNGDWTASGLFSRFLNKIQREFVRPGDLVFWGNRWSSKVVHVEICLNSELSIGASGGGSKTLTIEDAKKTNAFIKIRPISSRKNLVGFVNPYT